MIEPTFKQDPQETWWVHHGRCTQEDPELFFPVGSTGPAVAQTQRAIAVCRECPVRLECLEWSLETCQDAGVWGGVGEEERRAIRRQRRRDGELTTVG
jgi:WhiB family transcriptional regulator, redox-sensing transcriptional regulator